MKTKRATVAAVLCLAASCVMTTTEDESSSTTPETPNPAVPEIAPETESPVVGTYSAIDLEDCVIDVRRDGVPAVVIDQQSFPSNNMAVVSLTLEPDMTGASLDVRVGGDDVDEPGDLWIDLEATGVVERYFMRFEDWDEDVTTVTMYQDTDPTTAIFGPHEVNTIGEYDKRRKKKADISYTTREIKTAIGMYDVVATIWVEFNGKATAFTLRTY